MMSAGESGGQDFDINIAPIIDCFTVLITFMLASASFLSIGLLDAGVAAAGATAATNAPPPPINVTVELGANHKMVLKVTGKINKNTPIDAKGTEWNYEALTQSLGEIHAKFKDVNAMTLTADNAVEYRDVVKAMEVSRKTLPVVLLGGF